MGDRSAAHRLRIRLRAPRPQHAVDEPADAAAGEGLQPAGGLGLARGEDSERGRGRGRAERRRLRAVLGGGAGPAQLVRRGRGAGRPRDVRQQPPPAPLPQLVGEQRADLVHERRGERRVALLVGRAEGEEQDLLGPRDRRVQQVPLAREHVLVARQHEPAGTGEARARGVVEERLGDRVPRERALLEAADEDGAEAAGTDLERVGHQHRARRAGPAHRHVGERGEDVGRRADERRVGCRQAAQLGGGGAQARRRRGRRRPRPGRARLPPAGAERSRSSPPPRRSHPGTRPLRPRPRPRACRAPRGAPRTHRVPRRARPRAGRPAGLRRVVRRPLPARPVDRGRRARLVEPGERGARLGRGLELGSADADLEPVGGAGIREPAWGAQPGQQVGGGAARKRRAGRGEDSGAESRPGERDAAVEADRHAVVLEHLRRHLGLGGAAAHEHRDVVGQHAGAGQLQHLGGDELGLGALAARLEQPDRPVGRDAAGAGLEQAALEVVERRAGGGGVVLGAVGQQFVAVGERFEQLDGRRPAGERRPPGLVGERDAHLGVAGQRLDGVALQGRQVVEAVEEHRPTAPGGRPLAQSIERRPRQALAVDHPQALQLPVIGRVQRGELLRMGGGLAGGDPVAHRAREPRRAHERAAELGEQRARCRREAGRRCRALQRPEARACHGGAHHALARDPAEHLRTHRGRLGDHPDQPRERRDVRAEHHPLGRELAPVVVGVRGRRDDEHGLARQRPRGSARARRPPWRRWPVR